MHIEWHQIEFKYEHLHIVDAPFAARLMTSLAADGQQRPVLVVESRQTTSAPGYVLIDGYARVRALRRLGRDTVEATVLPTGEVEALLFAHRLDGQRPRSVLEEAWLLRELVEGHARTQALLARELGRTTSWVSRRLALVRVLPDQVQEAVRAGRIPAHSLEDLNEQLRQWCERVNGKPKRTIGWLAPVALFAVEKPLLTPLPVYVPEVYEVHQRRADVDGFVSLHTNHYSVPAELIGRTLAIRETLERVRIFDGHRLVVEHHRQECGARRTVLRPEHRQPRRHQRPAPPALPQEATLRGVSAVLATLLDRLRHHHGGQAARSVRQLHRMYFDYPLPALEKAVGAALEYGLIDLGRIERLVLRHIAGEFFRLPGNGKKKDGDDGDQ